MEIQQLFEKLREMINKGEPFFDLLAQAFKAMDDEKWPENDAGQIKHLRQNLATTIEAHLAEALTRAGYSDEETVKKTTIFIQMLFSFPPSR